MIRETLKDWQYIKLIPIYLLSAGRRIARIWRLATPSASLSADGKQVY